MKEIVRGFVDKHPTVAAFLLVILIFVIIWWLGQPIEEIYDPDGPPRYCRWYQDC